MSSHPGYRVTILMGSTNTGGTPFLLRAQRWAVNWKVDSFDVLSTRNWGVDQVVTGITDFDFSADCFWMASDNPHNRTIGPDVGPGELVSIRIRFGPAVLNLVPPPNTAANDPGYFFPRCKVITCHTEAAVRDVIRFNFMVRVTGNVATDVSRLETPGSLNSTMSGRTVP